MSQLKFNRRTVLGLGAAASSQLITGCISAPSYIRPDGPLRIAVVGVGNRVHSHYKWMSEHSVTALVDVDTRMMTKNPVNRDGTTRPSPSEWFPNAVQYSDYRELFEKPDSFDAVVVSTPDHTHFGAARRALELGKSVLCEKPLTYNIWESETLAKLARKHKIPTQMGNQGMGLLGWRKAKTWYETGVIGDIKRVHVWHGPSNGDKYGVPGLPRPEGEDAIPSQLDWEGWIGPAPMRPYKENAYHALKWRQFVDFGNGSMMDWWCHKANFLFKVLDTGYPIEVSNTKITGWNNESWPVGRVTKWKFPEKHTHPSFDLLWHDGTEQPTAEELGPYWPKGQKVPNGGAVIVGEKGIIFVSGPRNDDAQLLPEELQTTFGKMELTVAEDTGHFQDFVRAAKGEVAWDAPHSNFMYAGNMTAIGLYGNAGLLSGQETIKIDSKSGKILNAKNSDELLKRAARPGWKDYT